MTQATSRRTFLAHGAACATLGTSVAPWALNLAATSAASAQASANDYRALVCVFLQGANDNHNTVIPLDGVTYGKYAKVRGKIAVPSSALTGTELVPNTPWPDGRRMALHPALAPLKPLFDQGQLSLAMNVGTLIGPLTLTDYNRNVGRPPKLFSHNDQQSTWQVGDPDSTVGWGGRIADLVMGGNGEAAAFTAVTTSGGLLLNGNSAAAYRLGTRGATVVKSIYGSPRSTTALRDLMQQSSPHLFQETHASIARQSFKTADSVNQAIGTASAMPAFPSSPIGQQLRVVAQLIEQRQRLGGGSGPRRQIFLVTQSGWDMHNDLADSHPLLLESLAKSMEAFYAETVRMGLADKVTTFTASDFGRTLSNNGDGSDHGWGSYHFVLGGAVNGRDWVGQLPDVAVNGRHDVGGGRLLPAIAVDQYAATLAAWFGVPANRLSEIFPRIGLYDKANLGFMKASS